MCKCCKLHKLRNKLWLLSKEEHFVLKRILPLLAENSENRDSNESGSSIESSIDTNANVGTGVNDVTADDILSGADADVASGESISTGSGTETTTAFAKADTIEAETIFGYSVDRISSTGNDKSAATSLFTYLSGWYMRRSRHSKNQYYGFSIALAIITGIIPVLTIIKGFICRIDVSDIVYASLAFLAGLCAFFLNLLRSSENWVRFRGCAESLKAEACMFIDDIGEYAGLNGDDEKQKRFIEKMLGITGSERVLWEAGVRKKEEE